MKLKHKLSYYFFMAFLLLSAFSCSPSIRNAIIRSPASLESAFPTIQLSSLGAGIFRGGGMLGLSFSATAGQTPIASLQILFAPDAKTFSSVATLSGGATSYSWTVPVLNTLAGVLEVSATDVAGNTVYAISPTFTINSTPPNLPSVTLTSATPTNSSNVAMTVASCAGTAGILVNEGSAPSPTDPAWQTCTTVSGGITYLPSSWAQGSHNLDVWAEDSLGNVTVAAVTINVIYDSIAPTLALTSFNGGQQVAGGVAQSITWSASDSGTGLATNSALLEFSSNGGSSWSTLASAQSSTGPYSWTAPTLNNTTCLIRVTVTDSAGNSSTAVSGFNFTIDSIAPTITSISLNSGAASANDNYVNVSLTSSDNLTNISKFCLKYNNTSQPTASSSCWVSVTSDPPNLTPSQTLNLSNYDYLIGFTAGTYDVYAWTADAAGNISTLSNSGVGTLGVDKAVISYTAPAAPSVTGVVASSTNTPSSPLTVSDTTVVGGGQVFIKWDATSTTGLGANPISIYYTTDSLNYVPISTALPNAVGSGCTISGSQTGCYVWTNTAGAGYFQIRVGASDVISHTSFFSTSAMNVGVYLNFLGGATDPGTGGSASAASFFNYSGSSNDAQSFAVSTGGVIYFRDQYRGILKVDPATGNQTVLLPLSGTGTSYNDGAIASATVALPSHLAIDFNDRLLIYDYNAIRLYDPNAQTVNTLMGGSSATQITATSVAAATLIPSFTPGNSQHLFTVLPDGTIYFTSDSTKRYRVYSPTSGNVTSVYYSGVGDNCNANTNITALAQGVATVGFSSGSLDAVLLEVTDGTTDCLTELNPTSGAVSGSFPGTINNQVLLVTGMDGAIYSISYLTATINKFNKTTRTWATIAGSGTAGSSPDGSAAATSAITPQDIFVSSSSQIYFFEHGRIRLIDPNGNLVTVAGTSRSAGDGGLAPFARFGNLDSIQVWNNGSTDLVVTADDSELKFRQFPIGGNISTLAGTGVSGAPSHSLPANTQPIHWQVSGVDAIFQFQVHPTSGNIYASDGNQISVLSPLTGKWATLVGGGSQPYYTGDGYLETQISSTASYPPTIIGFDGTNILASLYRYYSGTTYDSFWKLYPITGTGDQTTFAGVTGNAHSNTTPTVAGSVASSPVAYTVSDAQWDSANNRYLTMNYNSSSIYSMPLGGTVTSFASLPNSAYAFAHQNISGVDYVYYCSTNDLKLHKFNVSTSVDVAYTWPISSMQCFGRSLIFDSTRESLIFAYTQNGQFGVAEYVSP